MRKETAINQLTKTATYILSLRFVSSLSFQLQQNLLEGGGGYHVTTRPNRQTNTLLLRQWMLWKVQENKP